MSSFGSIFLIYFVTYLRIADFYDKLTYSFRVDIEKGETIESLKRKVEVLQQKINLQENRDQHRSISI